MADARMTAGSDGPLLRAYVETVFEEMQQRMAQQREAVLRCLDGLSAAAADPGRGRRQRELQDALREAIEVLEETKRSFKSKRLGELREKLARVLADGT